jgi:hypothetical protein
MAGSRRDLIKAIGAGAAVFPGAEDVTDVLAQGSSMGTAPATEPSKAEAFLVQFETAWRPLDPQLRAVLRSIYARLQGLPPPAQLSPAELRRINASLSFYFNAGAPALPHVEERTSMCPAVAAEYEFTIPE